MKDNDLLINYSYKEDINLYYARIAFENIVKDAFSEYFDSLDIEANLKKNFRGLYFDKNVFGTDMAFDVNIYYVEIRSLIDEKNICLDKVRNYIYNILINKSKKDTLLWKTKTSINISYYENIYQESLITNNKNNDEENEKNNSEEKQTKINVLNFKLIIGVPYKNQKTNKHGIKYYAKSNRGASIIKYPVISIDNFLYKNHITNNNYTKYINLCKNIILEHKKSKDLLKTDIIETMLYNMPNHYLNTKPDVKSLRNIINYIRNFPLQNYKTIDEQEFAFLTDKTNFTFWDGKEIIKILENYYIKNFA